MTASPDTLLVSGPAFQQITLGDALVTPTGHAQASIASILSGAQAGSTPVSITPGASPYAYTAPSGGTAVVSGGTVSALSVTRDSTVVALGVTAGAVPVCAGDVVTVTYSVTPTMDFLPA